MLIQAHVTDISYHSAYVKVYRNGEETRRNKEQLGDLHV